MSPPDPTVEHTVRPATHGDVDQMLDVHAAVAGEGRWIGTEAPIDRERFGRRFRDAIDADDAEMFVAVAAARVVGNVSLHPTAVGVTGLGIAVTAGHRGMGVGSMLLEAAIAWCRERGVHKIDLEVWPHNPAGLGLYTKFGFDIEGRRRRQYRRNNGELWDSVVMGLVLDDTSPGSPYADADAP